MKDEPGRLKTVPAPVKNEGVAKRKSVLAWFMGINVAGKRTHTTAISEVEHAFFVPTSAITDGCPWRASCTGAKRLTGSVTRVAIR
jgi:hypothetical protein